MGMRTVFIPEGTSDEDLKAKFADDMAGKAVVMKLPKGFDESILGTMLAVQESGKTLPLASVSPDVSCDPAILGESSTV